METINNAVIDVKEMRQKVANMVYPLWKANKDNPHPIMDRGQALAMLTSNFKVEGELGKEAYYYYGAVTPEQIAECKSWWIALSMDQRTVEYTAILKIVNEMVW